MSTSDDEFLEKLRATFRVEAGEHLQAIESGLLELEKGPAPDAQRGIVETVFRAAHSLKGAARAVDFVDIESTCQGLEDVFAEWKRRPSVATAETLDILHRALDAIHSAVTMPARSETQPDLSSLARLLRQLVANPAAFSNGDAATNAGAAERTAIQPAAIPAPVEFPADKTPAAAETVRVEVAKLELRLLDAEGMLAAKLTAGQRAVELHQVAGEFAAWRKAWAEVEPEARRMRAAHDTVAARGEADRRHTARGLMRVLDFFEWSVEYLRSLEARIVVIGRYAEQDRMAVGKMVDDLVEDSKNLLMLPLSTLAVSLPKLVRDLCRDQGKDADLRIEGGNIEVDKGILEELKDPLIHLLRNSVDHGVEMPSERSRQGKPPRATIVLTASRINGSKLQLIVSDDGSGLDAGKLKGAAIKHGIVSAEQADHLSDEEAWTLVFRSGVSTSAMITQLSGRGLGLAIVHEHVERLGGDVSVQSRTGLGTTFRIIVPAVRARFRGVLVEVAERLLVVPTTQVQRVARARPDDIRTVEGRDTLLLDGHVIAMVRLADALELPRAEAPVLSPDGVTVLVLGTGDQRIAFVVDRVIDEQEVLVKALRKPLQRVRNVAAATVLGTGQVAPILNVSDLLRSARKVGSTPWRSQGRAEPVAPERKTVLIAEDSITSRMLLKTILESAGYAVKTAVDGMEAFTLLRAERFDLLVSDVEMPRLNGFDLTARIRADATLAELPVVLVTALETRDDRERGVDAGANAYIVKGSFDQSNLLDAVSRLI